MASEEDKALENLLDIQLKDQRESLSAIDEALSSDPCNSELLSRKGFSRLLQEADIVLNGLSHATEVKSEKLDLISELEPEKTRGEKGFGWIKM